MKNDREQMEKMGAACAHHSVRHHTAAGSAGRKPRAADSERTAEGQARACLMVNGGGAA